MSQGRTKSRTLRRVVKKTPGGRLVKHFNKRKPSKATCASCGKTLVGVPRERPKKLATLPKTQRRPERPYGGVLCSLCSRKKIKISL
jgi:large subunit ribosomal protein L34e